MLARCAVEERCKDLSDGKELCGRRLCSAKLKNLPDARIKWSTRGIPMISPALKSRLVVCMSVEEGTAESVV